jgi:hypothetical protein
MIAAIDPNAKRGKSVGFMDWGAYAHNWRPKA